MNEVFKIICKNNYIHNNHRSLMPYVVIHNNNFCLVFFDTSIGKYRYIDLEYGSLTMEEKDYTDLESLFEDNPNDKILNVELVIKGEFK